MAIPEAKSPPPSDLNAAIGGVRRGRELAAQLVALLRGDAGQHGAVEDAGGLAEQVLASFSTALSALDSGEPSAASDSPRWFDQGSSKGSTWGRKARPAGERRRGQAGRSQPYAWTSRVASKTLEDGHTWRKYGQKEIRDSKHPRCYFRCSHKHGQGCQAARQVQKSEEDPSMFLITYLGQHTCKNPAAPPRPDRRDQPPFAITFGTPAQLAGGGWDPRGLQPAAPFPQTKREAEDDVVSRNSSSSPEYLMLPELTPLEDTPVMGISSVASMDVAGDVASGFLGVEFTGDSFQFEDMPGLQYDDFTFVYC